MREGVSLEERTSDTVVPKRLKLLHATRTYDTRALYRECNEMKGNTNTPLAIACKKRISVRP